MRMTTDPLSSRSRTGIFSYENNSFCGNDLQLPNSPKDYAQKTTFKIIIQTTIENQHLYTNFFLSIKLIKTY